MITDKDIAKMKAAFATKDDLKLMENRQNKRFATKDDLKSLATKNDLVGLAKYSDFLNLKEEFITNLEKWKNELFIKIDSVLGRVTTAEEENTILKARQDGHKEMRQQLDERIAKLE